MELLALQGRSLLNALPQEAVPPNVIRHILKIIREVYLAKFQVSQPVRICHKYIEHFFNFRVQKLKVNNHCIIC